MNLVEKIFALYPELTIEEFNPARGTILIRNDMMGEGDYIAKWNHPTLPRPTDEQLGTV
jgi:hypothetical protein